MRVAVKLMLTFESKGPRGEKPIELMLSPGATIGQVLESFSIKPSVAKVILLNGRITEEAQELKDGDQLTVFPPLEGG